MASSYYGKQSKLRMGEKGFQGTKKKGRGGPVTPGGGEKKTIVP